MAAVSASPNDESDIGTSTRKSPLWLKISSSTALLVVAFVLYALPAPAHAGSCTSQSAAKTDPTTGWSWNTIWYCGNAAGAQMYKTPSKSQPNVVMNSTNSWFVCFAYGDMHNGGNNVWYYSLGDDPSGVWGYMPAESVWTSTDPWPGMAQCPTSSASPPPPANNVGKAQGNPVAIANADGRLEVFAIAAWDNSVWHVWQTSPGGSWSQWQSLGGWADQLSVTRNGDGRLELFVRGSDQALYHKWQLTPGNFGWSGWSSLGGGVLSMPSGQNAIAAAQNLDGHLEVFVIGTDHALHHKWQTCPGCGWSDWDHQGGWADQIAVSRNNDGRLEVFVRGSDQAMHHKFQTAPNGPGLSDWYHRGGTIDQIAVTQNIYGELEAFVVGTDHAIWHNWQTSPNTAKWNGWVSLGGWLDSIYASQNLDGRLEIFARGGDGALWHDWQLSGMTGWSGWNSEGGLINKPFVERNTDGRLEVFTTGWDGLVYHKWQNCAGCGWSGWALLGAPGLCTSPGRPMLTCGEIDKARKVFGDRIDYSQVRVNRSAYFPGQPDDTLVTPNGNIYWPLDDGDLSNGGRTDIPDYCHGVPSKGDSEICALIHEMTHVWQWQNGYSDEGLFGTGFKIDAILLQAGDTYSFQYDLNEPFVCYTIEQQGDIAIGIFYGRYPNNIPPNSMSFSAVKDPGKCDLVQPGPAPSPPP